LEGREMSREEFVMMTLGDACRGFASFAPLGGYAVESQKFRVLMGQAADIVADIVAREARNASRKRFNPNYPE
jgi:hypothetical protein